MIYLSQTTHTVPLNRFLETRVWPESGFRLMRWCLERSPAAENTLSALAEPLGMLKTRYATLARLGRDAGLFFNLFL